MSCLGRLASGCRHRLCCCMPPAVGLGLGCCMPWPWQHAHGGLPWPWLLHAHGLWPWPWLHAFLGLPSPWLLAAHFFSAWLSLLGSFALLACLAGAGFFLP